MNLKQRKKDLESLLQSRILELQRIEASRNQLMNQIIEVRGKLNLIRELEDEKEGRGTTNSIKGTNKKPE